MGDVNDFVKYQLLRLAKRHFERVLVGWMLTAADGRSDGGRIHYLKNPDYGAADPELYAALTELVGKGERSIEAIERSGTLAGCAFHSAPMPRGGAERTRYFAELADRADPNSLVFLDPDNGIEVASVAIGTSGSDRYVYWSELGLLRDAGCSILIYQHFPRVQRIPYLENLLTRLAAKMGDGYETFAAYTSRVGFLFALREEHTSMRDTVIQRCKTFPVLSFHS